MPLGAHMSAAGGPDQAVRRGKETGCETIQIFSKNSNRWKSRDLNGKEQANFHKACQETGISPVLVHTSYLINLASPDEELWGKSIDSMVDEIGRCQFLGAPYLVLHPGAHSGAGLEVGLSRVTQGLNICLENTDYADVIVLLEITAGQGTSVGGRFEQLARLLDESYYPERLGVCFDTCHAFAAGYDIRTPETFTATFDHFEDTIGFENLKAVHLNDTKGELGRHLDRHEHIGQGRLGLEAFRLILNDPRFTGLPMVLETQKSPDMHEDVENLATLRSLIRD
jgi:deoxyribonuclease-4